MPRTLRLQVKHHASTVNKSKATTIAAHTLASFPMQPRVSSASIELSTQRMSMRFSLDDGEHHGAAHATTVQKRLCKSSTNVQERVASLVDLSTVVERCRLMRRARRLDALLFRTSESARDGQVRRHARIGIQFSNSPRTRQPDCNSIDNTRVRARKAMGACASRASGSFAVSLIILQ